MPGRSRSLLPWVLPLAGLAAWASAGAVVPAWLLPPPWAVLKTVHAYIFLQAGEAPFAGRFASDAMASMGRVAAGFTMAAAAGLPLGLVSGRVAVVRSLLGASIGGVRAVPGIAWLPLALVWFGVGFKATLFLVGLAAFFPVYLSSAAGAAGIDPLFIRAGRMMGLSRLGLLTRVLVPAAMPQIVTGLRLSLGVSWAYLVLGELTGTTEGLGATLMDARMLGQVEMIVAGIVLIAVMGRVSDRLLVVFLGLFSRSARRLR